MRAQDELGIKRACRRYCLAFLEQGQLPWQWEPKDRVTNIKRLLFDEGCAISEDATLPCSEALLLHVV